MNDKPSKPSDSSSSGGISFNPWEILKAAVEAVPAMRYALAVLGLVAVIAIVLAWKVDLKIALCGSLVILGLMASLTFFARALVRPRVKGDVLYYASVFFVCVFALLITLAAVFLLTASAFGWPTAFHDLIFPNRPAIW